MSLSRSSQFVTPRAATLTLHATADPSREATARRGEPLLVTDRIGSGFVEVDYRNQRWFAAEGALEPWTGSLLPVPISPSPNATPQGWAPAGRPSAAPAVHQPPAVPPQVQVVVSQRVGSPAVGGWPSPTINQPCYACGRDWGAGRCCQFCQQVGGLPSGIHLSSPGKRLGGYILEWFLLWFTLVIGWFIWSIIIFKNGQTPAKQLLGMRAVDLRTGRHVGWGGMFVREVIAKWVISLLSYATLGIPNFWLVWDKDNQELWDKIIGSVVVDDPDKQLLPRAA